MSNIRFSPSPGFILIKVQEEDQQEILTVQDPEKTPASQGVVVAVGGPRLHESGGFYEAHVKVGDVVVFKPFKDLVKVVQIFFQCFFYAGIQVMLVVNLSQNWKSIRFHWLVAQPI